MCVVAYLFTVFVCSVQQVIYKVDICSYIFYIMFNYHMAFGIGRLLNKDYILNLFAGQSLPYLP